jgi:hypothetical protein
VFCRSRAWRVLESQKSLLRWVWSWAPRVFLRQDRQRLDLEVVVEVVGGCLVRSAVWIATIGVKGTNQWMALVRSRIKQKSVGTWKRMACHTHYYSIPLYRRFGSPLHRRFQEPLVVHRLWCKTTSQAVNQKPPVKNTDYRRSSSKEPPVIDTHHRRFLILAACVATHHRRFFI